MYDNKDSIYCYKNSLVLINKLGIKDNEKLSEAENEILSFKLVYNTYDDILDISELHRKLFGEIYDFAGEYRKENISKDSFRFAEYEFISENVDRLMSELKEESYLKNLDKKQLSIRLVYYMAELNVLHPFREGNGRTIRKYIQNLANRARI